MSNQSTRTNYRRPLAERFWEKVNKDGPTCSHFPELGPCWLWTGCSQYRSGRISYGRIAYGTKVALAHRVSWELNIGPIPHGHQVLHRCDNPQCVNPTHLFLGTQVENIADMVAKQRQGAARGEKAWCAKLTASKVKEIREKHKSGGVTMVDLAREYGVSDSMIQFIIQRKNWKHV